MTNEDAKAILLEIKNGALWKLNIQIAFDKAIKALENQCPSKGVDCEDCPANEPKTKVGHWISIYGNVKCSICGNVKEGRSVGKATHYCDFCGAKMESEGEK